MPFPYDPVNVDAESRVGGPRPTPAGWSGAWLAIRLAFAATILACNASWSALGQDVINREYKIKAAYLYNLGRYITWPSEAFPDPQAPFVIGVIEPDLVGADLQKIAEVKTIDGRPIVVRRFKRPEDVQSCHILFLPRGADLATQKELVRRLTGAHVLLVGETEEFLDHGGVIAFVVRENNVRLMIAPEAAEREKLQISSKLLQIAQTVN